MEGRGHQPRTPGEELGETGRTLPWHCWGERGPVCHTLVWDSGLLSWEGPAPRALPRASPREESRSPGSQPLWGPGSRILA